MLALLQGARKGPLAHAITIYNRERTAQLHVRVRKERPKDLCGLAGSRGAKSEIDHAGVISEQFHLPLCAHATPRRR